MGTWGIGVFENDTACDFAGDVAEGGDVASLETALDHVLAIGGGYLEASDAAEAWRRPISSPACPAIGSNVRSHRHRNS